MVIKNKGDVIKWLKKLRDNHPLTTAEARALNTRKFVKVFTDQIIKDRYTGLIEYLESDEVQ